MATYRHISTSRILGTYEAVDGLRIDSGLVRLVRKATVSEPEYNMFDPYVTLAIINLGEDSDIERI